jgi:two-component system, OmpR family, sensor histidine kinase ArlS
MEIKNRITLQFTAIVFLLLILFSSLIYYISFATRYKNFNSRLEERALNTAKLLLEVKEINADLLKDIRRNYFVTLTGEFVRIYDENDRIIFSDDTISFHISPAQLRQAREKGYFDFRIGDRQVVAVPYKNKYIITSSAVNIVGAEQLADLRRTLITGNLVTLLIIFLAGRFFAIQALKPISEIIKQVETINGINLSLRLDEGNRKDEISQLAISFNNLFNRLQSVLEKQNRFVANASHELRTPLTSITGEIEVTLMKERSKGEYIEVLLSVLEEAKVLTGLSNGLLQLAQTPDNRFISVSEIEVILFIEELNEEVLKRHPGKTFSASNKDYDKFSDVAISGNLELLKVAFLNVIDNAFKFSQNQPVEFIFIHSDNIAEFHITDNGIGINTQDLELVTSPFYRSDNAINIEGHGIGLSLTGKIIKLHEGTLEFRSEKGTGTTVIIRLPAKTVHS